MSMLLVVSGGGANSRLSDLSPPTVITRFARIKWEWLKIGLALGATRPSSLSELPELAFDPELINLNSQIQIWKRLGEAKPTMLYL